MSKVLYLIPLLLVVTLLTGLWYFSQEKKIFPGRDAFAQCLKDKGVTMYGADWCQHCQNEKKGFGESFKYVSYVECPKEPDRCIKAGVSGYPTWIFPEGKKLEGEQGLEKLATESGCVLEK